MDASDEGLPTPNDVRFDDLATLFFPVAPLGNGCFRATPTNHEFR